MVNTNVSKPQGVTFTAIGAEGERSTTAIGTGVLADALGTVSEKAAAAVRTERSWRQRYPAHIRESVKLAVSSTTAAEAIASAGLASLYRKMEFYRDGEGRSLIDAMATMTDERFGTVTIAGESNACPELVVPYRGEQLRGDSLRRQLERWTTARIFEPSFAEAITEVLNNPSWLDLSDQRIAVLGAGAELGPFAPLCGWRATIAAVDIPNPQLWAQLLRIARAGNGRVLVPVRQATVDRNVQDGAGADLLIDTPEIRTWLATLDPPLVVGGYAYLDGEAHVRVAMAMDVITTELCASCSDVVLATLLTPTDVHAVPEAVVEEAARRWHRGVVNRFGLSLLTRITGNRILAPGSREILGVAKGFRAGIVDALFIQQGPNYALAKRLQSWRAIAARGTGRRVSANVAPSTTTRSILKNRALAAAYRGAHHFGIEVFKPETSNVLMAALLVHDLRTTRRPADPSVLLSNPLELLRDQAAHGGLWALPYEARTALPLAAGLGFVRV